MACLLKLDRPKVLFKLTKYIALEFPLDIDKTMSGQVTIDIL